jgi:hypothetical protein
MSLYDGDGMKFLKTVAVLGMAGTFSLGFCQSAKPNVGGGGNTSITADLVQDGSLAVTPGMTVGGSLDWYDGVNNVNGSLNYFGQFWYSWSATNSSDDTYEGYGVYVTAPYPALNSVSYFSAATVVFGEAEG